ncbi:MAG: hypothetical protein K2N34_02500, partial [Lachnospiraceae bacterium]|nr:hypothetical protein [Lachnospiraceae bacterium]
FYVLIGSNQFLLCNSQICSFIVNDLLYHVINNTTMSKLEKFFSSFDMVVFVIKWYIKGVKPEYVNEEERVWTKHTEIVISIVVQLLTL